MNLKDKVVIVTGASQGIGAAIAIAFAQVGCKLVLAYRNNETGIIKVKKEIEVLNTEVMTFQGDLSDEITVEKLFQTVLEKFGTLDILINNAGKSEPKELLDTTKADWLQSFNDNFFSTVLCCKEALKIMKEKGSGKIINMSSINGIDHAGRPGNIAYSASKAAIVNFTKTLAKGYAPQILINAVAPGKTLTDYWKRFDSNYLKKAIIDVPIKRFIKAEEIADTFLFLARNDSFTGEIVTADGGFNLKEYN